jgi:hypothetical protein
MARLKGERGCYSMARPTFSYLFERGHPISIKEDRDILIGLPWGGMWKISFEDVLHAINLSLPTISLVYTSHFQFPLGLGNLCCCM